MASDIDMHDASPVPTLPHPHDGGRMHMSSLSSSSSISDIETDRRGRSERPRMASRKPSASILVPRDHPEIEIEEEEFPPDDARAMSPRRNSADLERLGKEARQTLQEQAKALQSSLQALAERIDAVKSDHDKLENENKILQDYIGGLTRNMTKSEMTRSTKARKVQK
ncbi:putative bZIP transcription factor [Penicillium brasilianum]|uniref:Putative bZIP transcription factor n=1 Tax=Penicillium brasilianum TaxID=104259 RepID=A0A0F7TLG1_PENBI|nr:putative bZIP transcription factor [Penicillium brasilianum]CEJ55853.1 Putative BZIP transcription factor [Penicillium brasilianum]